MAKEVKIEEYKEGLESSVEIPVLIHESTYRKLTELASAINKTEEETIKGIIDTMYDQLKKKRKI